MLGKTALPLNLKLGGSTEQFKIRPLVVDKLMVSLNLSGPFMHLHGLDLLHSQDMVRIKGRKIKLYTMHECNDLQYTAYCGMVYTAHNLVVLVNSTTLVQLVVPDVADGKVGWATASWKDT